MKGSPRPAPGVPQTDRVRSDGNWVYGDPETAAQMILLHPVGAPMPALDGWVTPRSGFTLSLHQAGPEVMCMTYYREREAKPEVPRRRRAGRPVQLSLFEGALAG